MSAQAIEGYTKQRAYSGYFQGEAQLQLLEAFQHYPFPEPEMERRLEMARDRFGRSERVFI